MAYSQYSLYYPKAHPLKVQLYCSDNTLLSTDFPFLATVNLYPQYLHQCLCIPFTFPYFVFSNSGHLLISCIFFVEVYKMSNLFSDTQKTLYAAENAMIPTGLKIFVKN